MWYTRNKWHQKLFFARVMPRVWTTGPRAFLSGSVKQGKHPFADYMYMYENYAV